MPLARPLNDPFGTGAGGRGTEPGTLLLRDTVETNLDSVSAREVSLGNCMVSGLAILLQESCFMVKKTID